VDVHENIHIHIQYKHGTKYVRSCETQPVDHNTHATMQGHLLEVKSSVWMIETCAEHTFWHSQNSSLILPHTLSLRCVEPSLLLRQYLCRTMIHAISLKIATFALLAFALAAVRGASSGEPSSQGTARKFDLQAVKKHAVFYPRLLSEPSSADHHTRLSSEGVYYIPKHADQVSEIAPRTVRSRVGLVSVGLTGLCSCAGTHLVLDLHLNRELFSERYVETEQADGKLSGQYGNR
jgi:hypothetical protein